MRASRRDSLGFRAGNGPAGSLSEAPALPALKSRARLSARAGKGQHPDGSTSRCDMGRVLSHLTFDPCGEVRGPITDPAADLAKGRSATAHAPCLKRAKTNAEEFSSILLTEQRM